MKKIFQEAPNYDLRPEEIAALTGNLFGAGSDTSSSTLVTFVLACCAFPEVLPKAWEELDRVVGSKRSPTMDDEPNLPYIKAFVKEVFRWRSVAIIGGQPHAPIQDDEYKVSFENPYCNYSDHWRAGSFQKAPGCKEMSGQSTTMNGNSLSQIASTPIDISKRIRITDLSLMREGT